MRFSLIFLLALSIPWRGHAQCVADAGPDIISCPNDPDAHAIPIGGLPTGSSPNGVATYAWYMVPYELLPGSSSIVIHASDILSDTTLANPEILDRFVKDTIRFYVVVTDSLGFTSVDSCEVVFSNFIRNLEMYFYTINAGDSVLCNKWVNIVGTLDPVEYYWTPSHGLRDSSVITNFYAKPTTSTNYRAVVTDAAGCSDTGSAFYFITVNPVGLEEGSPDEMNIYPNPCTTYLSVTGEPSGRLVCEVVNSMGQGVISTAVISGERMDVESLPPGYYVLTVQSDGRLTRHRFVKQ